MNWLEM